MLSTTTANRTCCIIDSERQQTGSRSFILWACASLIAKSMTSLSVSPVTAPCGTCHSWVDQLYHQLRMLKSLFKDIEHAPNIVYIHHSQNSYFNASSHPGIVQRYTNCTEILLKHAGLCCDVWAFVFSPTTSETYLRSTMMQKTYSLCSPSRPQWQSRQLLFLSVYKKLVLKNEERTKVFGNPNRLLSHCGHQGDQNN